MCKGFYSKTNYFKWDNVFKNGPSKTCIRHPLKNLKWYDLFKQTILQIFLKTLSHKFYLVNSWIPCPIYIHVHMHINPNFYKYTYMQIFQLLGS